MGLSKFLLSGRYLGVARTRILCRSVCKTTGEKKDGEKKSGDPKDSKCKDGLKPEDTKAAKAGQASSGSGDGKKSLIIGVYEGENKFELTKTAEEINKLSGGKICKKITELSTELKLGNAFVVTDVVADYESIAITSFGPKDAGYNKLEELDESKENIRVGVGAAIKSLRDRGVTSVLVDGGTAPDAAAEGAVLSAWRFQEFKSCADRKQLLVPSSFDGAKEWTAGEIRANAQNWARYLADMPANKMAPADLAQAALDVLCPVGVKVVVHDSAWIKGQGMSAFLAVASGSCEDPYVIECSYLGAKDNQAPVLVAAKGVTFDCGGLCLKRPSNMIENRGSMAGAAVVLASLKALAELKVPINVHAVIPVCENMISGQCMKVGDIVTAMNGLSIQIENTDMEGRLMLSDALVYGQAVHRPALVMTVATLTKGVKQATGGGAWGCFSNSLPAWKAAQAAGADTGDRPWRFPLWDYYSRQITNDPAVDLRNQGSGHATPCLGAAFLRNFVCGDWIHMDITGVGKLGHSVVAPYLDPHRMTGKPTRTVVQLLNNIAAQCAKGTDEEKVAKKTASKAS